MGHVPDWFLVCYLATVLVFGGLTAEALVARLLRDRRRRRGGR